MDKAENFEACMQELLDTFGSMWTEKAAGAFRKALWDIEPNKLRAATDRAIRELNFMPKPAQLRTFARDVVVGRPAQLFACTFHQAHDLEPSFESYHWCHRCRHFIGRRLQAPDDGKHERSGTRKLLEEMAHDLGQPVASVAAGLAAAAKAAVREPGDDLELAF